MANPVNPQKMIKSAPLSLGLAVATLFLTASQAEAKSFITVQPNASDTAYIITVSWEGGLPTSSVSQGNLDDKTTLNDSGNGTGTTVPGGALAGARIRMGLNNDNGVDQDLANSTYNNTTLFFWDGTDGSTAANGSQAAESHAMNIGYDSSDVYSLTDARVLVYCSGVQGVTSLSGHLGIQNSALYGSTLGQAFGLRVRPQASPTADILGLIMKTDRKLFPANGLAIMSMPYATGTSFGALFNVGTYTGSGGADELVVTTSTTYQPKVFKSVIAIEQGASSIANNGSQDFGSAPVGSNADLTFTVRNSGTSALNFTGTAPDYVTISGANPGDFTVIAQPSSPVAVAGSTTFEVRFSPTAEGVRNAVLTVGSNDRVTETYTMNVSGTGTPGDNGLPTVTSIVDNKSGGPIAVNTPITYTVSFSADMDDATVTSADFGNAGTAAVTIDSVSETASTSGVFTVQVTPTSVGTLILKINDPAVLNDAAGNSLVTDPVISDDTTITVNTAFAAWSGGAAADADTNGDGVDNGVAWVLGASGPNENAINRLPTLDNTSDATYVIFEFNRSDAANSAPNTTINAQYSNDLANWTTAVDDNNNVEIEEIGGSPADVVKVKLKRSSLAASGKIFTRLNVVTP